MFAARNKAPRNQHFCLQFETLEGRRLMCCGGTGGGIVVLGDSGAFRSSPGYTWYENGVKCHGTDNWSVDPISNPGAFSHDGHFNGRCGNSVDPISNPQAFGHKGHFNGRTGNSVDPISNRESFGHPGHQLPAAGSSSLAAPLGVELERGEKPSEKPSEGQSVTPMTRSETNGVGMGLGANFASPVPKLVEPLPEPDDYFDDLGRLDPASLLRDAEGVNQDESPDSDHTLLGDGEDLQQNAFAAAVGEIFSATDPLK